LAAVRAKLRSQWILLGVAITFLTAATVILAIPPIEF
jgi:hypothetical protein